MSFTKIKIIGNQKYILIRITTIELKRVVRTNLTKPYNYIDHLKLTPTIMFSAGGVFN